MLIPRVYPSDFTLVSHQSASVELKSISKIDVLVNICILLISISSERNNKYRVNVSVILKHSDWFFLNLEFTILNHCYFRKVHIFNYQWNKLPGFFNLYISIILYYMYITCILYYIILYYIILYIYHIYYILHIPHIQYSLNGSKGALWIINSELFHLPTCLLNEM